MQLHQVETYSIYSTVLYVFKVTDIFIKKLYV